MLRLNEFVLKYEVDKYEASEAFRRIASGKSLIYAMSGKMGSGKDTLGNEIKRVLELMPDSDYTSSVKQFTFATALRKEIDTIMDLMKDKSLDELSKEFNVEVSELENLKSMLGNDSIYDRTEGSRNAIQYWGTDVRRKQDPDYWVKRLVNDVIEFIAYSKKSESIAYVSDVRFPNEAQSIVDMGGVIVRLHVDEDIRVSRIEKRDGRTPTKEELNHVSETSLDDFEFEVTFDGTSTKPFELAMQALPYVRDMNEVKVDLDIEKEIESIKSLKGNKEFTGKLKRIIEYKRISRNMSEYFIISLIILPILWVVNKFLPAYDNTIEFIKGAAVTFGFIGVVTKLIIKYLEYRKRKSTKPIANSITSINHVKAYEGLRDTIYIINADTDCGFLGMGELEQTMPAYGIHEWADGEHESYIIMKDVVLSRHPKLIAVHSESKDN